MKPSERQAPVEPLLDLQEPENEAATACDQGCGHGQGCAMCQICLPSCWFAVQMRAMDAGDIMMGVIGLLQGIDGPQ